MEPRKALGERPVVQAQGWGWRHAGRRSWAVRGLDLVVYPSERVLLLGPSGSGKSTLLSAMAGLLHAPEAGDEEGTLLVGGVPASEAAGYAGIVFQDPASSLVMGRIGDEVAFGLENQALPREEIWRRVIEALRAVGLGYPLGHSVQHLSGGEQQRLAIAGVLAMKPRLWLLDEPTANLDPDGSALVRQTLREILTSSAESTLVMVEHKLAPVLELVNRAVVLGPEGVVADGKPDEVFALYGTALRKAGVWVPGPPPARLAPLRPAGPLVAATEKVGVRYPGAPSPALEAVDLEVFAGQALAITGPNGSGKSTLALVLASLLGPSSGRVKFFAGGPALPYAKWPARELVRWVGTVFQEPEHQFVASSVEAELAVGPRRAGVPAKVAKARVAELMERLGLGHLAKANPFTLSGGEKRRLSVATALATAPAMLVLDEPTFGQDASTWGQLVELLAEERDAGRAVVAVTHDEELVAALADRELRLLQGWLTPAEAVGGGRTTTACLEMGTTSRPRGAKTDMAHKAAAERASG
jgi:energy-coupling factor transporter ATP-binding protein EcfA2